MIKNIIDIFFTCCGTLGLLLIIIAFVYTIFKLIRKKKIASLFLFLSIVMLMFIPLTFKIINLSAGFILIVNALFYGYFVFCFLIRKNKKNINIANKECPTISIVIPCKNESNVIGATLTSMSQIDYPKSNIEIIVIDDNSTDNTLAIAKSMDYIKNLKVIHNSESYGKSNSINRILKDIYTEFILVLDADHLIDKDYINKALLNFKNSKVACVQSINSIRNGHTNILTRLIQMEYLGRYEVLYSGRSMGLFMGSGGVFKTNILKSLGGFDGHMLTEDIEVSYRVYEAGYKIVFDDSLSTYELTTIDIKNYFKQRHRWFRGIMQSFKHHLPKMLTNSKNTLQQKFFFIHVIIEFFALPSYLLVNVLYALDIFTIFPFDFKYFLYIETFILAIVLSVAIIKTKKPALFIFLPLIVPYYVFYALPNLIAIIDNSIIKAEKVWIKTDRSNIEYEELSHQLYVDYLHIKKYGLCHL